MSASHAAGSACSGECHKYSVLLQSTAYFTLIQTLDFMEIDIILGGYTSPKASNPSAVLMVAMAPSPFLSPPLSENSNQLSEKLSSSHLTFRQIFWFRSHSIYNNT
jgi:hypothetical protein